MTAGPFAAAALSKLGDALSFSFGMFWEILWALILGFALSGAVQAVVSKRQMRELLPDDSPRRLTVAAGLGAASSSCSYASVALARSLFRRGANFTITALSDRFERVLNSSPWDRSSSSVRTRTRGRAQRSRGSSTRPWRP